MYETIINVLINKTHALHQIRKTFAECQRSSYIDEHNVPEHYVWAIHVQLHKKRTRQIKINKYKYE